jgi:outer membrane protein TolC
MKWKTLSASGGRGCKAALLLLASTMLVLPACTIPPKPISNDERAAEAASDIADAYSKQEPLHGPLTLDQAFARALKYNLDARVKMMEETLAQNDLDLSRLDMLPKAVASAGYMTRDVVDASSSNSIITNTQSLEPSTSSDINRRSSDLTLSWNVLDFGVSYISARQQGDRQLIAQEQRRRVVQTLMQDVRGAFWRAASAQKLSKQVSEAIRTASAALPSARKAESEALRSPLDSLRYQKFLLDLLRHLEAVQRLLEISKTELAALINLPPTQRFTIAVPGTGRMDLKSAPMNVRDMEEVALLLNPDIREMSYQRRISIDESRKQLLKLLPGITLTYSPNFDSNSFLVHNYWTYGAARVSGYLNNVLQAPFQIRRAENAEALADERRKAVSVATLTKLHIAYAQYMSAAREYHWSNQLADVDGRLYQQIANRASSDAQSELERISAQVSAVDSELRKYQSYAEAQFALGRIYSTMGLDPIADEASMLDIKSLSGAIQNTMRDWRKLQSGVLVSAAKSDPTP